MPGMSILPKSQALYALSPKVRATGFTVLIFLILLLRRPESLARAQFWAEDGSIFFAQQMELGFLHALPTAYAGYLHVVARIIAGASSLLTVRWVPTAYSVSALAVAALSCSAFYWPIFRRILSSDSLRASCCLVAASAMPAANELLGTLCNLQWFLCLLMILAIAAGGALSSKTELALLLTQLLIALSAPGTIVCGPFLVWQAAHGPVGRRLRPVLTLSAMLLQLWFILHGQSLGKKPNMNFNAVFLSSLAGGISRSVLSPAIGVNYLATNNERSLLVKLIIGLILIVVLFTSFLLRSGDSQRRRTFLSTAYIAAASIAFAMSGRSLAGSFLSIYGIKYTTPVRYFFLPGCMFIFVLALFLEHLFVRLHVHRFRAAPAICLLLIYAFGITQNFVVTPLVNLDWPGSAAKLQSWRASKSNAVAGQPFTFPVNPPPWMVSLQPVLPPRSR